MHIDSFVSRSGRWSRREIARMIDAGRVTLNGKACSQKCWVDDDDLVLVDGMPLPARPPFVYLAFNKPRGITCTAHPAVDGNIISFIGYPERIFPIGRLDKDSEGLILLTNDGSIVNPLMKMEFKKEKEYTVTVNRAVSPLLLAGIQKGGINIRGKTTSPCKAVQTADQTISIILTQGLNRQIRRMCSAYDYRVQSLKRTRIGPICLHDLPIGKYRPLTSDEIQLLKIGSSESQ
ncbi:pseudouridine synthase [Jeotgalibacillus campisalis]|uniref:Pseudouridine synthase n=1 Tax=Jeotgalibacillus campisalis TaxID=220754 RepID=A0A0C2RRI7_9BACL|nr:pseudouridine synthase [Jeotgalibacillus campisalis]KIL52880.1 RNA pseudouridine synthase [Jeotgalibacillus campisalis]